MRVVYDNDHPKPFRVDRWLVEQKFAVKKKGFI